MTLLGIPGIAIAASSRTLYTLHDTYGEADKVTARSLINSGSSEADFVSTGRDPRTLTVDEVNGLVDLDFFF